MHCISVRRTVKKTIIVAFTGLKVDPNYTRFDLSSFQNSDSFDAILLRDSNNIWYTKGVEGRKSVGKLARFLKNHCRWYENVIFVGSSMGGFAAILYGVKANADTIITFNPQTVMTTDFLEKYDSRWMQFTPIKSRYLDLTKLRRSWFGKDPQTLILCSESEPEDVAHAEVFAKAHKFATVVKIPGVDHSLAEALKRTGQLRRLIAGAVSGQTIKEITLGLENHE